MNTFNGRLNIGEVENRSEEIIQNKAWKDKKMDNTEEKPGQMKVKLDDRTKSEFRKRKCCSAIFEMQLRYNSEKEPRFSRNDERHQSRFQKPNKYQIG